MAEKLSSKDDPHYISPHLQQCIDRHEDICAGANDLPAFWEKKLEENSLASARLLTACVTEPIYWGA